MGIKGLLPRLTSITTNSHVSQYCDKIVAVDASSFLYKSVYSCAKRYVEDLAQGRVVDDISIRTSVKYMTRICEGLYRLGIQKIILVMDGKRWYVTRYSRAR